MIVGIVGAGIAGLSCADRLGAQGIASVLFDKGKRPGGRLSSLTLENMAWDFGAQYLRPGSGRFAQQVAAWRDAGLLASWRDGPDSALVGVPSMASLIEAQCAARDVRFSSHIQRIDRKPSGWWVWGPDLKEGPFDAIIVAVPPEQAIPLLSLHDFSMARDLIGIRSHPCWTAMVGFSEPIPHLPAFMQNVGPIAWAARNNSKPGRPAAECWVLQAGLDWSTRNLEMDRNDAASRLLAGFAEHLTVDLPKATFLKGHRWRFSQTHGERGTTEWNENLGLGVCGDWCLSPRIEGAWISGQDLADRVIGSLAVSKGKMVANARE